MQIAGAAQVDPALVRYYFGDKGGVLHTAAKTLLDQVQERSGAVLSETGTLKKLIRSRLELLMDALSRHPRLLELVLKEVYGQAGRSAKDREDLERVAQRGLVLTQSLLDNAREKSSLRTNVDARFLHIAILGVCTFYVESLPLVRVLFGEGADQGDVRMKYLDFATELLAKGLLK